MKSHPQFTLLKFPAFKEPKHDGTHGQTKGRVNSNGHSGPDGTRSLNEVQVTYRGVVYPWQCDHMGHMNVMWHVNKFDEACWQLLASVGLTTSRMEKENLAMAAVEQHNQYKLELYAGDPITIRTSILEVDDKSIRMLHELTNDETGCVAATSEIIGLQLDATSRRPCSIAGDVRNRLFMKMASGAKQDELPS